MQQLLNKLDSQLYQTIGTVQDIVANLNWDSELYNDADMIYQHKVKELYEMVKEWSEK